MNETKKPHEINYDVRPVGQEKFFTFKSLSRNPKGAGRKSQGKASKVLRVLNTRFDVIYTLNRFDDKQFKKVAKLIDSLDK